ncbi:MAG TPA: hypothetical protein VEH51_08195 [Burkholderiales bacterium]|nr:hypothetical protein [Burkholderiales bacterium]
MAIRKVAAVFAACFALLAVGCRIAPIYNVNGDAITSPKADLTMSDVNKAIHRAGASLGWQMQDAGPGHMIGTLHLRDHVAVVDITYDTKSYSINYKDSTNLQYDAQKGEIHKNYNGWIQNLESNIRTQLLHF